MDLNDLKPVIDLMTQQEERLSKKIDEVHATVKEQNSRIRKNEVALGSVQTNCALRTKLTDEVLKDLKPSIKTTKFINAVTKHPKTSIFIILGGIIGIQSLVMVAIEHQWIGELIKFIKP